MSQHKFELGSRLRCIVTGFQGIAISRVEYLNGCIQYAIKPPIDKDGKELDGIYIDHSQLEFVDDGVVAKRQAANTGGPQRDAPKF